MADKYRMSYKCSNCGFECCVDIPKKQEALNFYTCSNCGRSDLKIDRRAFDSGGVYVAKGSELRESE